MGKKHAFTNEEVIRFNDRQNQYIYHEGMTLRDYFAGQALTRITTFNTAPYEVSEHCYAIADAMLETRENKKGV